MIGNVSLFNEYYNKYVGILVDVAVCSYCDVN